MRNRVILISVMVIGLVMLLPHISLAAMGNIDTFSYAGLKEDLLGRGGSYKPDGSPDGMFHVSISGVGAIAGFSVRAQERGVVWHSAPDTGELPILIIDSQGKKLNQGGGFPIIPLLISSEFKLYLADDGYFATKTDNYILEVKYIDGSSSSSKMAIQSSAMDVTGLGYAGDMKAELFGFSDTDMVGPNEILAPDGKKDVRIRMSNLERGVITAITLKNRTGRFSIWDTEPSNGKWSIAVVGDEEIQNSTDGSILLPVSEGGQVELFIADNGSFSAGDTTYEIVIVYKNGSSFSIPVSREGIVEENDVTEEAEDLVAILYGRSGVQAKPGIPDILTFENDYTSASERISGNGEPDWGIQLRVNMKTSIISLKIENIDGEYGIWDTLPGNGKWLVAVTDEYGKILNESNGSVDLKINSPVTLWLWITDTGAISRGKTSYKVTVMSGKGDTYSVPVRREHYRVSSQKPETISAKPHVVFKARFIGPGDKDFVGKYDGLRGDGSKDSRIRIFMDKLDARIIEVFLKDKNNKNLVWDTIPGNTRWSMMVTTTGGTPLNSTDGSVSIPVKGKNTLNLWVQDNGTLKQGKLPFEIQLKLEDGRVLRTSLSR